MAGEFSRRKEDERKRNESRRSLAAAGWATLNSSDCGRLCDSAVCGSRSFIEACQANVGAAAIAATLVAAAGLLDVRPFLLRQAGFAVAADLFQDGVDLPGQLALFGFGIVQPQLGGTIEPRPARWESSGPGSNRCGNR